MADGQGQLSVASALLLPGIGPARCAISSRLIGLSFGFALGGNVLYALSQWLLLVVLAKLGTPGIVGQFSFALAVTAPVILFSQLNLRGIQATEMRGEFSFADYAVLRGFMTVAALILIVVGCIWFGRVDQAALIITVGTAKAFDSVTDVIHGHWQRTDGCREWKSKRAS